MKTTVEISDPLLDEAKAVATREATTVRALIEEGLRKVLAERSKRTSFKLRDGSFRGEGLHPDAGDGSWEKIRELIYERPASAPRPPSQRPRRPKKRGK